MVVNIGGPWNKRGSGAPFQLLWLPNGSILRKINFEAFDLLTLLILFDFSATRRVPTIKVIAWAANRVSNEVMHDK